VNALPGSSNRQGVLYLLPTNSALASGEAILKLRQKGNDESRDD
jgi:hypothetical protein